MELYYIYESETSSTDRDVDGFASSCGPNKQTRLLMRHKLLHKECIPHCINSWYNDLIECHFLQNTISLYQPCMNCDLQLQWLTVNFSLWSYNKFKQAAYETPQEKRRTKLLQGKLWKTTKSSKWLKGLICHTLGIGGASLISSVHSSHLPIPYRSKSYINPILQDL